MDITIKPSSTPQAPSGPMIRSRVRAIKADVASFIHELPILAFETWLLPHFVMLCILRCDGIRHKEARKEGKGLEADEGEED